MKTFTIMTKHGDGRVSNTVEADRHDIKDGNLQLLVDDKQGNITTSRTVALFVHGEWKQLYIDKVAKIDIMEELSRPATKAQYDVDIYSELFHAWLKEHEKYETFMEAGHNARLIINEFNTFYEAMD